MNTLSGRTVAFLVAPEGIEQPELTGPDDLAAFDDTMVAEFAEVRG
ncbi:hypothetical protein [Streptacidiphilus cavernicola]|uniref:Uncharacterized protein n=1 Tax=Streptacidiphilus cavernicola TaxID=3342716 RepID=A0ABV6VST7_9ACTN